MNRTSNVSGAKLGFGLLTVKYVSEAKLGFDLLFFGKRRHLFWRLNGRNFAWSDAVVGVKLERSIFGVGWRVQASMAHRGRLALWTDFLTDARNSAAVFGRFSKFQAQHRGRLGPCRCGFQTIFCGAWRMFAYHFPLSCCAAACAGDPAPAACLFRTS